MSPLPQMVFDRRRLFVEPKWDGFRTLVFLRRQEIMLQSRDESR
jgi:ATP-dependent DNA ligase